MAQKFPEEPIVKECYDLLVKPLDEYKVSDLEALESCPICSYAEVMDTPVALASQYLNLDIENRLRGGSISLPSKEFVVITFLTLIRCRGEQIWSRQ